MPYPYRPISAHLVLLIAAKNSSHDPRSAKLPLALCKVNGSLPLVVAKGRVDSQLLEAFDNANITGIVVAPKGDLALKMWKKTLKILWFRIVFSCFFPRASERRVLPIVGVCISSSHLHTFSSSHLLSHLLILTSSHLHIFSSSHLLIFTSSHLHIFSSSNLLIFTSAHLHIFTYSHTHILTSSLSLSLLFPLSFLSLLSLSLFSLSPSLSFSL